MHPHSHRNPVWFLFHSCGNPARLTSFLRDSRNACPHPRRFTAEFLSSPSPCTSLHQLLQCSLQNKKAKVTLLEISSQLLTLTDAFSLSPNKRRLHCFVEHVFGENSPSCFGADIGKFVSPVWKSINLLGMLRFRVPFTNSGMISAFSLLNAIIRCARLKYLVDGALSSAILKKYTNFSYSWNFLDYCIFFLLSIQSI